MSRAGRGHKHSRSRRGLAGAAAALAVLGLCTASARADDASSGSGGLWDKVLGTLDLRTKAGDMPDFVKATHPDPKTLKFIPTGEKHVARPVPVKSAADIEAAKQALDAARDAQLNPPAAPPGPKPAKGKPGKGKLAKSKAEPAQN